MKCKGRIGEIVHGVNSKLSELKVLVVGVGGIGCEVLKVICVGHLVNVSYTLLNAFCD